MIPSWASTIGAIAAATKRETKRSDFKAMATDLHTECCTLRGWQVAEEF